MWLRLSAIFIITISISCSKKQQEIPFSYTHKIDSIVKQIKYFEYNNVFEMYKVADQLKKFDHTYAPFFSKLYTTKAKYLQYAKKEYLKTFDSLYQIAKKNPEIEFARFEIDEIIIGYYYTRSDYKNASDRLKGTFDYIFQEKYNYRKNIFINKIQYVHSFSNIKERLKNSEEIIHQLKDSAWTADKYDVYKAYGYNYVMQGESSRAKKIFLHNYKESKKHNFDFLAAESFFLYLNLLPDAERIKYYTNLIAKIMKTGRYSYLSNIYRNIGHSYTHLKNYNQGFEYYKKSIEIDSIAKDSISLGYTYAYTGWVYDLMNENKEQIPNAFHKKGLEIAKDKDVLLERLIYERMTWAAKSNNNIKLAEKFQNELIDLYIKEEESFETFEDVFSYTLLFAKNKDYEINKLLNKSILFEHKQENNRIIIASFLLLIAIVIFSLIRIRKKNQFLKDLNQKSSTIKQQNKALNAVINKLKISNNELENFATIVAHDIKTPLSNIHSFTVSIDEDTSLDSESKNDTKFILRSCKYLTDLINGVLMYSSINKNLPPTKKIDTNKMVKQILEKHKPVFVKRNINVVFSENFPIIIAHEFLIYQLFTILIENSIQQIENIKNPMIEISYNFLNKTFTFKDNGKKIPKEFIENVFESNTNYRPIKENQINSIRLRTFYKILKVYSGNFYTDSFSNANNMNFNIPSFQHNKIKV